MESNEPAGTAIGLRQLGADSAVDVHRANPSRPKGPTRALKCILAVLLALLAVLQYQFWLGDRGMPEVRRLKAMVEVELQENARLAARNRRLAVEVHDLKTSLEAVEERARTDLGMIGRNETFYYVVKR